MHSPDPPSHILITGASGFVGQALASALLSSSENGSESPPSSLTLTDLSKPPIPHHHHSGSRVRATSVAADLTDPSAISTLIKAETNVIYILHGLMSSASEANIELSLKVNIDSIRNILDFLRKQPSADPDKGLVKIVFASSTAVYGPHVSADELITERTAPDPRSSYGAQKHVAETLINDFSRRGLLDGRVVRLPTVLVRPGAPTGAASSFASGMFREPLRGMKTILPVRRDMQLWICSPRTVVKNLIHAPSIPASHFGDGSRVVNLPGSTVSVEEMLDALQEVGGDKAMQLVEEREDPAIEKIVEGWPTRLDTAKGSNLGFSDDTPLGQTIRAYAEEHSGF